MTESSSGVSIDMLLLDRRAWSVSRLPLNKRHGVNMVRRWWRLLRSFATRHEPPSAAVSQPAELADRTVPCGTEILPYWGPQEKWVRWNHGTVPAIAHHVMKDAAYHDLPILADALEDAGCEDEAVLRHCREGTHTPNCWVPQFLIQPPPGFPTALRLADIAVAERRGRELGVILGATEKDRAGSGMHHDPYRFANSQLREAWHRGVCKAVDGSLVVGLLPGFVGVFSLADPRRRNTYFAGRRMNEEMATFFCFFWSNFPFGEALAARTRGNEWVVVLRREHLDRWNHVIAAFGSRSPRRLSWVCRARSLDGEERVVPMEAEVDYLMSFRWGLRELDPAGNITELLQDIRRKVFHPPLPPGQRWEHITGVPHQGHCPYCGTAFSVDWELPDSESCRGCGACLDFQCD
jgi:hypothetical protein